MVEYRLWCEFRFDADELWIHRLLGYDRGRCLGPESSSCMGLGDRQLCVLDRYWSCGNAYLGDSFFAAPEVAEAESRDDAWDSPAAAPEVAAAESSEGTVKISMLPQVPKVPPTPALMNDVAAPSGSERV